MSEEKEEKKEEPAEKPRKTIGPTTSKDVWRVRKGR
jgi:hypothetical protein